MKKPRTFSTRQEAEHYIAGRNLAGKKKPQTHGGPWYLVVNREGTVNRSLFTEVFRAELRRLARRESWPASKLAHRLQNVPADSEKLWREICAKGKKAI